MRLPFFDPHRDEVAATATDLITRFGLRARDEASHLAQLSAQMHSRWHRVLYELVAHEIDASFVEAQKRLGLRQSASGTARLAYPQTLHAVQHLPPYWGGPKPTISVGGYTKDTKTAAGALRLASASAT